MRHRVANTLLALLLAPGAAAAAGLQVAVVDDEGAPVADAVVSVLPVAGSEAGAGNPRTHTIDQHALRFDPYLQLFRPGDAVVFRNSDRTSHHVYSFSPTKAFETMVVPGDSTKPMTLEQPGVVAVGCNIHDRMVTYLVVSDAPWVARTGADGVASFATLPAGDYAVRAWQPRLRPGKQVTEKPAAIPATAGSVDLRFELALLPDARRQPDRETSDY
jgi:plastocyanin